MYLLLLGLIASLVTVSFVFHFLIGSKIQKSRMRVCVCVYISLCVVVCTNISTSKAREQDIFPIFSVTTILIHAFFVKYVDQ